MDTDFGKLIVSDLVPSGTILLVPPVTLERYINRHTGEVKEYLKYDAKAAGVITNVKL